MRRFFAMTVAATSLLAACPEAHPVEPAHRDAPFVPAKRPHLRVVLIGDTGLPNDDVTALRKAVIAERKDVVVALGDLVYPYGPACPDGVADGAAKRELDAKVGATIGELGAPVLLVLGNHDTTRRRDSAEQACFIDYAASRADLVMPDDSFIVDYGVAVLGIVNTMHLDPEDGRALARAFASHGGWTIGLGHHVLKTYRDKVGQDIVKPFLKRHALKPDIWANGHAHLLQYGVYDGIHAITSGTAAKRRERPSCPPECGDGEVFGTSEVGYALLDITEARVIIQFKDTSGKVLHETTIRRGGEEFPVAKPARPEVAPAVDAEAEAGGEATK